jgi:hypothetical protein
LENTVLVENQEQVEIIKKIKSLKFLGIEESRFILSDLKGKTITTIQFKDRIDEITGLFVTGE